MTEKEITNLKCLIIDCEVDFYHFIRTKDQKDEEAIKISESKVIDYVEELIKKHEI